ncbi:MAG: cache domain-containing protein [Marinobacterium sp.]|nr:cache domain-containing protein [Marinobacterium sp.]
MSLKSRILLLAIVPLLIVTSAVTLISITQARALSEQDTHTLEEKLLNSKRQELRHYVQLALTSIEHLLNQPDPDEVRIRQILRSLTYGEDGYFFVYHPDGTNLVHPYQPSLEGQNLHKLQDREGNYVIQDLLDVAHEGGFHRYLWGKPSEGGLEDKLSYVVTLPQLGWMLGTGLYIDDITAEIAAARQKAEQNIRNTFFTVLILVTCTSLGIVLIAILINVRTAVQADERIRTLAQRYIQWQIAQRFQCARELKEDVTPLLRAGHAGFQRGADPVAVNDSLEKAISSLERITGQLRPSPLDELGLKSALQQLADQFAERTGIRIRTRLKLPDQSLPSEIANTLYRIAEEALNNSEHHAEPSQVKLNLWQEDDNICLELEDDGRGFYASEAGVGLTNMRERTELLSGSFELLSKPGQGTLIRATLPGHSVHG